MNRRALLPALALATSALALVATLRGRSTGSPPAAAQPPALADTAARAEVTEGPAAPGEQAAQEQRPRLPVADAATRPAARPAVRPDRQAEREAAEAAHRVRLTRNLADLDTRKAAARAEGEEGQVRLLQARIDALQARLQAATAAPTQE